MFISPSEVTATLFHPKGISAILNYSPHSRLGRAMAQAVSRMPPTAEARVRDRFSSCGICDGQSGTGTGFLLEFRVFPVSNIPP
jgi:hypothetical protein